MLVGTDTPYIYKGALAKRLKPAFGHDKKRGQTRASVLSEIVKAWPFGAFAVDEVPLNGVACAFFGLVGMPLCAMHGQVVGLLVDTLLHFVELCFHFCRYVFAKRIADVGDAGRYVHDVDVAACFAHSLNGIYQLTRDGTHLLLLSLL